MTSLSSLASQLKNRCYLRRGGRRAREAAPQFREEFRPVFPGILGVQARHRVIEHRASPVAVEAVLRRFVGDERQSGLRRIEFGQSHLNRATAAFLRDGPFMPVGQPVLKGRQQEAAEAALPSFHPPQHLAGKQMLEEALDWSAAPWWSAPRCRAKT